MNSTLVQCVLKAVDAESVRPQGALGIEVVHEHVGRVRAEVATLVINNGRSTNMAGIELLSDQGYRLDGRKATELRKVEARMGVFGQADGSAYLEQGNTKVLAVVYGPHEVSGTVRAHYPRLQFVGLRTCELSPKMFIHSGFGSR